jgi:hypothetical protein
MMGDNDDECHGPALEVSIYAGTGKNVTFAAMLP